MNLLNHGLASLLGLLLPVLPSVGMAATETVFQEGFENDFPGTAWQAGDSNSREGLAPVTITGKVFGSASRTGLNFTWRPASGIRALSEPDEEYGIQFQAPVRFR
jgi:hypothetical protein